MKSGMLAEAFLGLQKNDFSEGTLKIYEEKVHKSYIKDELYRVRNFHQTLSKGSNLSASFPAGINGGGD